MNKLVWFAPGHPAQLVIGFTIWSLWFIAMYAGLSVACQLNPPDMQQGPFTLLNAGLFVLTLLVTALLLFLAWRSGRYCASVHRKDKAGVNSDDAKANHSATSAGRFIGYISTVLYLIAAAATLAGGLPVLVYAPCS